jgi:pimeloyl-ACP methyl ester carboxylesterase
MLSKTAMSLSKTTMSIRQKTKPLLIIFLGAFFLFAGICPGNATTQNNTTTKDIATAAPAIAVIPKTITYKFTSCLDGEEDCYSWRRSKLLKNSGILLVYLHSLTGDFNELYKSGLADAINKAFPSLSLLACNYGRTPSWGNAAARIDISNNIRQVMKKTAVSHIVLASTSVRSSARALVDDKVTCHIVLVGTSMGASAALAYAATAPSYIKNRIIGIVAVAPCAELADLYQKSAAPQVKPSLEAALGGSATDKPALYHQNSLDACLAFLPQPIKIAIITTKEDTIVPIAVQMDVVRDLNNRDINIKSFELEGKSEPPPIDSIIEGLHFVLP